jgi:hypothetical protein
MWTYHAHVDFAVVSCGAEPGRSLCSPADEVVPSWGVQKARSRDGRRTHSTESTLISGPHMSRQPQHEHYYYYYYYY